MATSWRNKKNYPLGVGSLNADISSSVLTIVLSNGQGANFPSATFTITIDEEIILIDSRSTDTLTVNASGRGYDSTTAAAHAAAATVANYQIVKDFTDLETAVNTVENIIGGVNPIADDTYLKFGTSTDVKIGYDETTNDRLDFRDGSDNVLAFLKDNGTDGIFGVNTIQVTSGTTATLYNTVATTVNAFGAATTLNMGAGASASATLAFTTAIALNTAAITSNQTTVALLNTNATTINAFGAATTIQIGQGSSATFIINCITIRGNTSSLNLCNSVSTSINFAGAATTLNIGNSGGTTTMAGSHAIGSASTNTCTMTSRLLVRSVTDAGPMTATPGTQREIVYNTSDSKFYGCTVTHATAATWVAFN